jgi:hypothetical protein
MLACEPLHGTTQGFDGRYFSRLVNCLPGRKPSTLKSPLEKSTNAGKKKPQSYVFCMRRKLDGV